MRSGEVLMIIIGCHSDMCQCTCEVHQVPAGAPAQWHRSSAANVIASSRAGLPSPGERNPQPMRWGLSICRRLGRALLSRTSAAQRMEDR